MSQDLSCTHDPSSLFALTFFIIATSVISLLSLILFTFGWRIFFFDNLFNLFLRLGFRLDLFGWFSFWTLGGYGV